MSIDVGVLSRGDYPEIDQYQHTLDTYNNKAFLDKCGDALNEENIKEIARSIQGFSTSTLRRRRSHL